MLKRLLLLTLVGTLFSCGLDQAAVQASNPRMPDWAADAVIYEVNVRQFSDAGTFAAVKSQLPRLRDLDRKSTRLNSSHIPLSRMPSSA